jgi:hypothetical protein
VLGSDRVQLRLGPDALDIAEPFAALLRALPRRRRDSTADQITTPWLFPAATPAATSALPRRRPAQRSSGWATA